MEPIQIVTILGVGYMNFMLFLYCGFLAITPITLFVLIRSMYSNTQAQSCSRAFAKVMRKRRWTEEEIKRFDINNTKRYFYSYSECFWRVWDWSSICCIRDKQLYQELIALLKD